MSCPDCENSVSDEEIFELIKQHHERMEAEFTRRMVETMDEVNRQVAALVAGMEQRPATATLH